jgi:hypothetical protein
VSEEKEGVNNERLMLALETKKLAKLKDMQREIESTAPLVKAANLGQQAEGHYMQPTSTTPRGNVVPEKKKKAADFYFTKGAKGSEGVSPKVDFMAKDPSPDRNVYAARKKSSPIRNSGRSPVKGNGGGFQYDISSSSNTPVLKKKGISPSRDYGNSKSPFRS